MTPDAVATVGTLGALPAWLLVAWAWQHRSRPAGATFAVIATALALALTAAATLRPTLLRDAGALDATALGLSLVVLLLLLTVLANTLLARPAIGFREVFEAMHEAGLVVAPDGTVMEANPAAVRLLGEREVRNVRGEALLALAPQLEAARRATGRTTAPRSLSGDLRGYEASISHVHDARHRRGASVIVVHDERQDRRREQDLQHATHQDPLTGAATRAGFELALLEAIRGRDGRAVGLLYVDLDGFESVNDAYGHGGGDAVLVEVVQRLRRSARRNDVVGRMGGDEFALLLPDVTPVGLAHAAERVHAALQQPLRIGESVLSVGASVGLASAPRDGDDAEHLLAAADARMRRAKQAKPERAQAVAAAACSAS
jgi:diguanylate cyclase (GGDEF)-like protein